MNDFLKNAMNLRNVTIWTTGVLMILLPMSPIILLGCTEPAYIDLEFCIFIGTIFLVGCGSPLLVSLVVAVNSKRHISIVVLFVSTILYGLLSVATCAEAVTGETHFFCVCRCRHCVASCDASCLDYRTGIESVSRKTIKTAIVTD